jgi:hypothetical protein
MLEDEMQGIVGEARNREHMRAKLRHRALADATSLWRIWRDIGEKAHETAAKWPGIPSPRGPSP